MKIEGRLDGTPARLRLRDASKSIFGNRYLFEVALEIAKSADSQVFAAEIARSIGIADNQAGDALKRLESAGFLVRVPGNSGQPRIYYRPLPTRFWQTCEDLAVEILDRPSEARLGLVT